MDIDIFVTDITDHTIRSLEHEVQTLENLIKALINRAEQELSLQDVSGTAEHDHIEILTRYHLLVML